MSNKLIVCDVDGVILNFSRGMKEYALKNYDVYLSEDPMDWGWNNAAIGHYLSAFWHSENFAWLRPYDGIVPTVTTAAEAVGADLVFLTDVPEYAFDKRLANLSMIGLDSYRIEMSSDKVAWIENISPNYDAVVLIDDKVSTVLNALEHGIAVVYPVRGYNWNELKSTKAIPYYTLDALQLTITKWGTR